MDPAIISLKDFFKGIYFKYLHTQLNQTSKQNLRGGGGLHAYFGTTVH